MAVLTREQVLDRIKKHIGDDTSDESLKFIEDMSDTLDDYENKTKDTTNWENKYKENDEQWRKKYKERFFNSTPIEDNTEFDHYNSETKESNLTYENLFKEETK